MTTELPMVARFQLERWSAVRRAVHDLPVGVRKRFPLPDYFNCKSTVDRLNHAYEGTRAWRLVRRGPKITITRLK